MKRLWPETGPQTHSAPWQTHRPAKLLMGTTTELVPKSQFPHPQDGDPQFIELVESATKVFALIILLKKKTNLSERDHQEQKLH